MRTPVSSHRHIINIHEAKLRTLKVEIRSLTVNEKQVTQSVFRQLYAENCLDCQGNARGQLWGRVNYRWTGHEHEHLVWQLGDELRRDCLFSVMKAPEDKTAAVDKTADLIATLFHVLLRSTDPSTASITKDALFTAADVRVVNKHDPMGSLIGVPRGDFLIVYYSGDRVYLSVSDIEQWLAGLGKSAGFYLSDDPASWQYHAKEFQRGALAFEEAQRHIRDRAAGVRRQIDALPQLFIAV